MTLQSYTLDSTASVLPFLFARPDPKPRPDRQPVEGEELRPTPEPIDISLPGAPERLLVYLATLGATKASIISAIEGMISALDAFERGEETGFEFHLEKRRVPGWPVAKIRFHEPVGRVIDRLLVESRRANPRATKQDVVRLFRSIIVGARDMAPNLTIRSDDLVHTSMKGELWQSAKDRKAKRFWLIPSLGRKKVECTFRDELLHDAIDATGKTVTLTGTFVFKEGADHPRLGFITGIDVCPPVSEVIGSAARFAGSAEGDDYMARIDGMRDEWE